MELRPGRAADGGDSRAERWHEQRVRREFVRSGVVGGAPSVGTTSASAASSSRGVAESGRSGGALASAAGSGGVTAAELIRRASACQRAHECSAARGRWIEVGRTWRRNPVGWRLADAGDVERRRGRCVHIRDVEQEEGGSGGDAGGGEENELGGESLGDQDNSQEHKRPAIEMIQEIGSAMDVGEDVRSTIAWLERGMMLEAH